MKPGDRVRGYGKTGTVVPSRASWHIPASKVAVVWDRPGSPPASGHGLAPEGAPWECRPGELEIVTPWPHADSPGERLLARMARNRKRRAPMTLEEARDKALREEVSGG